MSFYNIPVTAIRYTTTQKENFAQRMSYSSYTIVQLASYQVFLNQHLSSKEKVVSSGSPLLRSQVHEQKKLLFIVGTTLLTKTKKDEQVQCRETKCSTQDDGQNRRSRVQKK